MIHKNYSIEYIINYRYILKLIKNLKNMIET